MVWRCVSDPNLSESPTNDSVKHDNMHTARMHHVPILLFVDRQFAACNVLSGILR